MRNKLGIKYVKKLSRQKKLKTYMLFIEKESHLKQLERIIYKFNKRKASFYQTIVS